ncbi:MAG: aminopeptidase P N-terminal domain-containing protein [Verrucomicrobia bacterium]|nr:aminopeptidase P N-terminal domain-containing protein [Verrucomicrobiota bacterium]MBI3867847.1 aminopeptidase P N-terminal domain-containing protein [Verrucomicrobiota bacterium]
MRYSAINPELFIENRRRLTELLLPNSLAVVNANDILPTNADGTFRLWQNSDLFHLTGVNQEESILLLYPGAHDPRHREMLFLRETSELIAIWEGRKLTREEARKATGIENIHWISDFPALFHRLMCECDHAYLNSNEHKRAAVEVETRDARFVRETQAGYPLHSYQRLARLTHQIRVQKSPLEVELMRKACRLTGRGFRRALRFIKPGVNEMEIEAEFAHEFIRGGGGFSYSPIIGSGANACVLHYLDNDQACRDGDIVLIDVGASYANYHSDMTRTVPVNGRFTPRQRKVYNAVLRILRAVSRLAVPGKLPSDWQKEAERLTEEELLKLGLLRRSDVKKQDPLKPAFRKYFMHGVGHPLGLDVHDVGLTTEPMRAGWVMTVEPAIYVREEGFAVRLENNILVREGGNADLMEDIPIEADEIEELMARRKNRP